MAERDVLYHDLLDALRARGCAVCRWGQSASESYINALLYEGVVDVDLRQKLRDARGLCYRHGWRMAQKRGSVLGTAIVYRDIVNTLIKALEAPTARSLFGSAQDALPKRLAATGHCPACQLEADAERRAVKTLLKHLDDGEVATEYLAAGGLCLPHFQLALSHARGSATRTLAEWQAAAWRRLRDELDELIRKHDHRFRSEPLTEREADAWTRAVAAVVGEPPPPDRE